ncbi:MAG: ferrochelatase, partial [Deltaproteobacteria bacterium]|nr:ferrochelatase [Deltaproteobacteria bacterium]
MKGLILVNLGTPESPTIPAVRCYLNEFLSDPDVIDAPAIVRWLLLHAIILPFRPRRSAHQYQQIWTKNGSPLLYHTNALAEAVQKQLGSNICVAVGMRYGNPSIATAIDEVLKRGVHEILFFPLFPQYSNATTGSIEKRIKEGWRDS